jgi:hypothetical protein
MKIPSSYGQIGCVNRKLIRAFGSANCCNARRVRKALKWLKDHNPLYRDITINENFLQQLEDNPVVQG